MSLKNYVVANKDWKILYNSNKTLSILPNGARFVCEYRNEVVDLEVIPLTLIGKQLVWKLPSNSNN